MRTRTWFPLAIALALALPPAPAHAQAPAAAPAAAATTYAFGKASTVTYDMIHQLHKFSGVTHSLRGKVSVAGGKLVVPFKLSIPVVSFDSGNSNRDANALLSLDAARFPSVALTIAAFTERARKGPPTALEITGDAAGQLVLHGVTRSLTIPIKALVTPEALTVDAAFDVALTDYGIERPSLLFKPVEDAVHVTVRGVAAPVP